jgi:fatty acid desaturase
VTPYWRESLAPYTRANTGRAMLDLATAVVPYAALTVLMYFALAVSYLLVLAIAVPAAGFLLRTYMVFHDCAHGSLLPSRRANTWLGRALGLLGADAVAWDGLRAVRLKLWDEDRGELVTFAQTRLPRLLEDQAVVVE